MRRAQARRANARKPSCAQFCLRELGRYKTPKVIRFVGELPKGPSGKVQRLKLVDVAERR